MKKGFTLIELLVVVLIIGILTAIVVPQYQYVVYKSRYTQLITLCDSIVNAQVRYRLATGNYTTNFDQLDIEIPAGNSRSTVAGERDVMYYSKFSITLLGTSASTGVSHDVVYGTIKVGSSSNMNDNLNYYHYYPRADSGAIWPAQCRCVSEFSCTICEKLGAVYSSNNGEGTIYYLYK